MDTDQRIRQLEARLKILEDKEEIRALMAAYAYHAWKGNGAKLTAMFTDDGEFRIKSKDGSKSDVEACGRARLSSLFSNVPAHEVSPMIHDLMIDIDGDEAAATSTLDCPNYQGDGLGYIGRYKDDLRRIEGSWRIRSRSFSFSQGSLNTKVIPADA